MKRIATLIAISAALAIPATALAAKTIFLGGLDGQPDSALKLKVKHNDAGTEVRSIAFKHFSVACDGGHVALMRKAKLSGSIDVGNKGGFRELDDNGETVFKVRGELDGKLRDAEGTFRYSGELEATDGVTRDCDSGRMDWSAGAERE